MKELFSAVCVLSELRSPNDADPRCSELLDLKEKIPDAINVAGYNLHIINKDDRTTSLVPMRYRNFFFRQLGIPD